MRGLFRWLGLEAQINDVVASSFSSVEQRLDRLAELQNALQTEVVELKTLINQAIRRNEM